MHYDIIESSQLDSLKEITTEICVDDLGEPEVDSDFVERLLGRKGNKSLSRSTRTRLENLKDKVIACIEPGLNSKVYSIKSNDKGLLSLNCGVAFKSGKMARTLEKADWLSCFIITIGPKLDRLIDRLMGEGRMADAYVADVMGSGAVESLATRFHDKFAQKIAPLDQSVSLRFSPGYCDWVVTEQPKLFSLLDHLEAGVELGKTSLMSPRKSISAVFGIFDQKNTESPTANDNPCRRCGKKDCLARRIEATPPSH